MLVVLIAMAGIFYVESVTTPIIENRQAAQANAALYEMFGVDPEAPGSFLLEEVTEEYPTDGTVTKVFVMKDSGSQVGVIYQAEAAGINPGIKFLFALNSETNESIALSIIANAETAGIGKDWLEDQANLDKYGSVDLEILKTDGIDTTAGVTLTGTGLNNGIKNVLIYHGVNFLGEEAPETPEEMVIRLKAEWLGGAGTDVTSNYEENVYVTEVLEGNGTYVFSSIYAGFEQSEFSTYMLAIKDGQILGFVSVETFETVGIGQTLVEHPDFAAQFVGKDVNAFSETGADYVAGSTAAYTLDGINESILEVLEFYNKQLVGGVDEEAPVLELNTARPTTFEVGSEAPNWELYVTGTDNEDDVVVVSNDANTVDFNTAGSYTVTFTASDAAGNVATPVELVIEITDAPVEFILIPAPAEVQTVLEGMASADGFHDEGITTDLIKGVYTGRDAEGNVLSVFYDVISNNGSWAADNSIMVQFAPGSNSIVAVNVYDKNATYYTNDFAPNAGVGEDFDSPLIAAAWAGINGTGQVSEADLDTVSGTTAEESFPSMIESIEAVLTYQIDNSIGGAN
jgi:Na+-translocating ferredoxin:NAD+ oxidoreductase RnfG subunit